MIGFVGLSHLGIVSGIAIASKVHSFRLNLALRAGLIDAVVEPPFRAATLAAKLGLIPRA